MNDTDILCEVMPSYGKFLSAVLDAFSSLPERLHSQMVNTAAIGSVISLSSFCVVSSLTLILTLARSFLARKVILPFCARCKLAPRIAVKMEESCWEFIFNLVSTLWTFYLTVIANNVFQQPCKALLGWRPDVPVHWSFKLLYAVQTSYFIQLLYSQFFLDIWKKESAIMVFHHIITILILGVSYIDRNLYLASLIMLLHYCSDIFLETAKMSKYFKIQNGKIIRKFHVGSTISLAVYTVLWFLSRLYYFPLKVIYTITKLMEYEAFKEMRFSSSLFILILVLCVMNLYWTVLLCEFLFRLLTGRTSETSDVQKHEERVITIERKTN